MSALGDSLPPTPAPPPLPPPQREKGTSIGFVVALALAVAGCVLLLWFLLPVVLKSLTQDSRGYQRLKAQIKNLELGVKGYQTEYSRLPSLDSPPPLEDNSEGYDTTSTDGHGIIKILMGTDSQKNPRGVTFYDPPGSDKWGAGYTVANGLVDVWGTKGYIMIFDYDGDGVISDPKHPGKKVSASVLIYSAGPDEDFSTWDDNITSWER